MTPTREVVRPATQDTPEALVPDAAPPKRTTEEVVQEIRLDVLDQPQRYLEEVVVPFGGE